MKKHVACLFVSVLSSWSAWAQPAGLAGATSVEPKGFEPLISSGGFLAPFKYIEPPVLAKEAVAVEVKRTAEQKRIMELSDAGNYQAAGTLGMTLMAQNPLDAQLQLVVANSLAWSGRVNDATAVYQGISSGSQAKASAVGLANIQRWRGRDDLARPMYQRVLTQEPDHADAKEGLMLAERELSPRTTLSAGAASDSAQLKRRIGSANHKWRDKTGAQIFEIESSGFYDWTPTDAEPQTDVTFKYQNLALPLKPSLELSMPTKLHPAVFGAAHVKLLNDQLTLGAGRLDWGKMAAHPVASRQGLAANFLSAEVTQSFSMGTLVGRLNYYGISDNNAIWASTVNFNSSWRPFGSHFKPFAGVETREADRNVATYWSPAQGSGSAYAGLMGEWGDADWNFFASGQLGAPLWGDAGNSWSVSAGAKRWVTNDIALGLNVWSMASWRDNSAYRSQSIGLNLEKIWH